MLARRLQLEQADAAAKAALADSMAARDEQQRTRDDLRSKLAEPSLNQAASLKEKIPTVVAIPIMSESRQISILCGHSIVSTVECYYYRHSINSKTSTLHQ